MNRRTTITHEFVEHIPPTLEEEKLYISISFATAAHRGFCGCGMEVVTPLTPTDWALIFDGETVSLDPSIGNWSFPCQSHYWIERNAVIWARRWSQEEIEAGRADDRHAKRTFFEPRSKDQPYSRRRWFGGLADRDQRRDSR